MLVMIFVITRADGCHTARVYVSFCFFLVISQNQCTIAPRITKPDTDMFHHESHLFCDQNVKGQVHLAQRIASMLDLQMECNIDVCCMHNVAAM